MPNRTKLAAWREVIGAKEYLLDAMDEVAKAAAVHLKGPEGDALEGGMTPHSSDLELRWQPSQGEMGGAS